MSCKKDEDPESILSLNISSFFFFKSYAVHRSALPTYKYGAGCGASVWCWASIKVASRWADNSSRPQFTAQKTTPLIIIFLPANFINLPSADSQEFPPFFYQKKRGCKCHDLLFRPHSRRD